MIQSLTRTQITWRAAQDIADGSYVNLGIGLPVLVANHLPADREIILHSENGIVGIGPAASEDEADPDLVDAGGQRVTLRPGAALVDSAAAFGMIVGGNIDITLLGAFQVASNGDFANWDSRHPWKGPLVGGAMDLAAGAREVRVIMQHATKDGEPRLVKRCGYPLTAPGVVKRIYTDLAIVDVVAEGFVAQEIVAGLSPEALAEKTGAPIAIAPNCATLTAPEL